MAMTVKTCCGCKVSLDVKCFSVKSDGELLSRCRYCNLKRKHAKKEDNDWYKFEEYCIEHHSENNDGFHVYHWKDIPEELLYKCGFFAPEKSVIELKRKKLQNPIGTNPYEEFGLDGIAFNGEIAHALQMKCYKDTISCDKLGSFLAVTGMMRNVGKYDIGAYLYYTGKLSNQVSGTLHYNNINCEHIIDWKNEEGDTDSVNSVIEERQYQIEALKKLGENVDGFNLIDLPCGLGKTYIIQRYINDICLNNVVVVFCPLIEHVNQFYDRMNKLTSDPNREALRIDSNGGLNTTRDPKKITEFINNGYQSLLISTFDSVDVIKKVFAKHDEEIMVVVDEVHRITDDIEEFAEKYRRWIGLSGTPLDEQRESANAHYHMPICDAIEQKYITDYEVYLPFEKEGVEEMDEQYWLKRCEFIITGMLRKGVRKCIVYCQTQEYCNHFSELLDKYAINFHNEEIYTGIITSETKSKERTKQMKEFEGNELRMSFLFSVRILNECIDIPVCDSVYFAQPSSSFDDNGHITAVQRMMRAMRLDPTKSWKKAKIFVFAEDNNQIFNMFTRIKNDDVNFVKKVGRINSDYEEQYTKENEEIEEAEKEKFEKASVGIMSLEEMWNYKYGLLEKICEKYGCLPTEKINKELFVWVKQQKKIIKNGNAVKKRLDKLKNISVFKKWIDESVSLKIAWENKYIELKKHCEEHNCFPTNKTNEKLAKWTDWQKSRIKKGKMSKERLNKFENISIFKKWISENKNVEEIDPEVIWKNNFIEFKKHCEQYNFFPLTSNNKKLYRWFDKQKQLINKGKMKKERQNMLENILIFKKWVDENIDPKIIWENNYVELKKHCEEHNCFPSKKNNEKLFIWTMNQKQIVKKGKMIAERQNKLENILIFKKWIDENKDVAKIDRAVIWENNYNELKQFCSKNNCFPTIKTNKKLFGWTDSQKQRIKKSKIKKELLDKIECIPIFKEWIEENIQ